MASITQLLVTAKELTTMAEKAGMKVDVFINSMSVLGAHMTETQYENRAQSAEKEAITRAVNELDGELTPDIAISEILSRAGVRSAQGTRQFAKREKKRVLALTHQPTLNLQP